MATYYIMLTIAALLVLEFVLCRKYNSLMGLMILPLLVLALRISSWFLLTIPLLLIIQIIAILLNDLHVSRLLSGRYLEAYKNS